MSSKLFPLILLLGVLPGGAEQSSPLKLTGTIPLPGVNGRIDHFAVDTGGKRLFVAALGNKTVEILDIAAGKRLRAIAGCSQPQGLAFVPGKNWLCVANGGDGTIRIYDATSLELLKKFSGLPDADNIRFDENAKLIYAGYGDGALAILDTNLKKTGEIKLQAHPESFQLEKSGNRIFVNVPGARRIAVVDRGKRSILATWPMERFQANFPMALDQTGHRLFVGCRKPARLVVFDTTLGKPIADVEISGDTDDVFYDANAKCVYLSCGEGFIDVVGERGAQDYIRLDRLQTSTGARTALFSPELSEFYLAVPARGNQQAEIRVYAVQR